MFTYLISDWIKDFHIKPDILTQVEEKVANMCELISTGKDFLKRTPIAQALRLIANNRIP